jgi:hypothetical protein
VPLLLRIPGLHRQRPPFYRESAVRALDWIATYLLFPLCWLTHYPARHYTMPMTDGRQWCPTCLRAFGRPAGRAP